MTPTMDDLREQAKKFLANCGKFTLDEHNRFEQPENTSVNEILGMAVRVLTLESIELQRVADEVVTP